MPDHKPTIDDLTDSGRSDAIKRAAWNSTPLVTFLRNVFRFVGYAYFAIAIGTIPVARISSTSDHFKSIVGNYWMYGFGTCTVLLVMCALLWPVAMIQARKKYSLGEQNLAIEADQKKAAEELAHAKDQERMFRRARMGTSPLAYLIRLHPVAVFMILLGWGLSLMFAWDYLAFLWTGEPVPVDRGRHLLDPSKTGYGGLYPFAGIGLFLMTYFLLWDIAWMQSKKYFEAEMAWASSFKFRVLGQLKILSDGVYSPYLKIYYEVGKAPDIDRMEKLAAGMPKEKIRYNRERSEGMSVDELKFQYEGDIVGGRRAAYRFMKMVHQIVEAVSAEYEIEKVELS